MLHLSPACRVALTQHGAAGYPDEVCGYLVGTLRGGVQTVAEIWPARNAWGDAPMPFDGGTGERFFIAPADWYKADTRARAAGLALIGCYHSHPDAPAYPSRYDLAMAQGTFPGYAYLILAVRGGVAADLTAWVLRDDYTIFDPLPILGIPDTATD